MSCIPNSAGYPFVKLVCRHFVPHHIRFYDGLNKFFNDIFDKYGLPAIVTADNITIFRTLFVFPCLWLWASGWCFLAAMLVLLCDLGDFLDGVVARWWRTPERLQVPPPSKYQSSRRVRRLHDSWGQFFDAVMDKLFIVPVWVFALGQTQSTIFTIILWCLILLESGSGFVRTLAYYSGANASAPPRPDQAADSSVKSDEVGKAKQTFEMVGSALFVLEGFMGYGELRLIGALILAAAIPLSMESVRRKVRTTRVYYYQGPKAALEAQDLLFLEQAKSIVGIGGGALVVGVPKDAQPLTAAALGCVASVDYILVDAPAPEAITEAFLKEHAFDVVACRPDQAVDGEVTVVELLVDEKLLKSA